MIYYIISISLFALSLLTAIVITINRFKVLWNSNERIIIVFLFTTLLLETISSYILWTYWISTARIMDALSFISIILMIWWFYLYLKNRWLAIGSCIFISTAFALDLIFNQGLKTQLPISSISIAIVILISVFSLMRLLLLRDDNNSFKKLRPFWISMGFLVYQVISMTMILFLPKLSRMEWELNLVISFMNILLYGCIAYALQLKENYE